MNLSLRAQGTVPAVYKLAQLPNRAARERAMEDALIELARLKINGVPLDTTILVSKIAQIYIQAENSK